MTGSEGVSQSRRRLQPELLHAVHHALGVSPIAPQQVLERKDQGRIDRAREKVGAEVGWLQMLVGIVQDPGFVLRG